jgi:hypothetical protein
MILLKKNIQTTIQKNFRYGRYQFQSNVTREQCNRAFPFFSENANATNSNVKKLCKVVSVKCLNSNTEGYIFFRYWP